MSERKHTPGPWRWFGDRSQIYLATRDRGRQYVMGFWRLGLNGAQPTFQMNGAMVPSTALMRFEVGNQAVCGVAEAKEDPSVYRYDIRSIDHPDAHLIAAAPDLLEALEALLKLHEAHHNCPEHAAARAAIAKARGTP